MKPTIFERIMIGYLVLFIPMVGVSAYTFSQFALFRGVTDDILQIDNRMIDLVQKISDSILTQTGFERKYIITKDQEFIHQFSVVEADVHAQIDQAISIARNTRQKEMLIRIRDWYAHYKSIFKEEAVFVENNQPYFQDSYKEEKEKTVNGILLELKSLKLYIERDTYDKVKRLGESVSRANQIAIVMAVGFILLGIAATIFTTRSITIPLSFMRKKTKQIAGGDFECGLDLSSPPEIGELAQDFNLMCSRLKAMDKMKSDFFSLMAHELRTPLASIREGTNILLYHQGGGIEEKQNEILRIIAEESNRLTDLVNSLLDLSKMEAGMMALSLEKTDIGYLIHQSVSGMQPLAMTKKINISVIIPPDLPALKVDKERILQALRNLIGNAVKFTPRGGQVTICAQSLEGSVKISVSDTGPGIAQEDINVIFDKFRQGAMTSYSKIKGTGLGLAIVKHIIIAHGGKIWVESEIGQGSIFIFVLPA